MILLARRQQMGVGVVPGYIFSGGGVRKTSGNPSAFPNYQQNILIRRGIC